MSPHRAVLVDLVKAQGWTTGAELGVDKGVLFNMLLTGVPGLSLIGVDTGVVPKRVEHVHGIVRDFPDRARFLQMTTNDAAGMVPDGSLDFVFIDADHSASAVTQDIAHWQSKVRKGGWFGGHDYNNKFPGVVQAVQKAFGAKVKTWPGSIWGVWIGGAPSRVEMGTRVNGEFSMDIGTSDPETIRKAAEDTEALWGKK